MKSRITAKGMLWLLEDDLRRYSECDKEKASTKTTYGLKLLEKFKQIIRAVEERGDSL